MAIRILPQNTINRIAAGEVIERPSSAVKELVENSIDAGADEIDILIENGGRNFISVLDNGSGMAPKDLELAVERHATSKLPDDDLLNINNFGFRGEALPSIGSVCRLAISSRAQNESDAWQVRIDGGDKFPLEPAAINKGTLVEIRDLFFATPARLKFLKSERTEAQHIIEVVNRIAMAHPNVAFSVVNNGKNSLRYKKHEGDLFNSRLERISEITGREFSENSIAVQAEYGEIKISGYASLPTYNRGSNAAQFTYVNNRPVRDKLFQGAIRASYQDFLSHDRHPVVVLFLEVNNEDVDVNVHPAKLEVRFRDANQIRGFIISALRQALASAGFRASNTVAANTIEKLAAGVQNYSYQPQAYIPQSRNFSDGARNFQAPLGGTLTRANLFAMEDIQPQGISNFITEELPAEEINYPLGMARCQLHDTYIVAQTNDGIVIVDQHAAHERIVYEKMKTSLNQEGVKTQSMLIPEVVEMDGTRANNLIEKAEDLAKFGLKIEKFGEKAVIVREVPALLQDTDVQQIIRDIADDLEESGEPLSLSERIEHICGTIACHGSVRAGRKLNIHEMNSLLREMEATPHTGQCNHGRPTYIELKLKDIERLFGRK